MFSALVAGEGNPAAIGGPNGAAIGVASRQLLELVAADMGNKYAGALFAFVVERNLIAVR